MENKYYTPELEELHVGYQCEMKNSSDNKYFNWEICTFKKDFSNELNKDYCFEYLDKDLKENNIRTKYLDISDLESLEWVNEGNLFFKLESDKTDRWYLSFYPEYNRIEFCDNDNENSFAGTVKSINEFRNIIKYLGI